MCAKLLGMNISHLQVYIDNEIFGIPSPDITITRRGMVEKMKSNEKLIDFNIEHLFEV